MFVHGRPQTKLLQTIATFVGHHARVNRAMFAQIGGGRETFSANFAPVQESLQNSNNGQQKCDLLEWLFARVHPFVPCQVFSQAKTFGAALVIANKWLGLAVNAHVVSHVLAISKFSMTNPARMHWALWQHTVNIYPHPIFDLPWRAPISRADFWLCTWEMIFGTRCIGFRSHFRPSG